MIQELTFAAELSNLAMMRRFLRAELRTLSPEDLDDILLAVNEAATNIMVHGYKDQMGEIKLQLDRSDGAVTVWLHDDAPPFDPTTYVAPDMRLPLEQRPMGKMGVFLILSLMNEVTYRRMPDNVNTLMMNKKLKPRKDGH